MNYLADDKSRRIQRGNVVQIGQEDQVNQISKRLFEL